MADTAAFTKLVPGFDFLQGLVKNAGSALPNIGQWVAPTLNPEELEKRIDELRTVQFWLEQNARMLGATIQALEVQRMTLSTLKTMNVHMDDLRESLKIRIPGTSEAAPAAAFPDDEEAPASQAAQPARKSEPRDADTSEMATSPVDPMQWWGALTKQFTELAANALKDSTAEATRSLAAQAMKQSIEAAAGAMKPAEAKPSGADAPTPARASRKRAAPKR